MLSTYQVDEASASTLPVEECATSGRGRPYMFGEPWAIPGYIEAEYYDRGGMGVRTRKYTSNVIIFGRVASDDRIPGRRA